MISVIAARYFSNITFQFIKLRRHQLVMEIALPTPTFKLRHVRFFLNVMSVTRTDAETPAFIAFEERA